ncbi:MAG: hypothetical protein ACR2OR_02140 [Hyphomicrobiales bacterium]
MKMNQSQKQNPGDETGSPNNIGFSRAVRNVVFAALALVFAQVQAVRADWVNLTGAETAPNIAEITVLDDRVRMALEIYIQNLPQFKELVPDALLKSDAVANRPPLEERVKSFATNQLKVIGPDGEHLPVELKRAEPRLRKDRFSPFAGIINPYTRRKVPEAPKDKRVLFVELDYPFTGKPETLTIVPPMNEEGRPTVTIGFIAYHKAVPIIDFRYLTAPAQIKLDWDDPWYTKFENPNLKRHHKSALMSFLYVEPREVRHEVLIRIRDLQEWVELDVEGKEELNPNDQKRLKEIAKEFFMGRNPLKIDGEATKPASARAAFLTVSLSGLQVLEGDKPIDHNAAILGIILSYPIKHIPKNIAVDWELFSDRIKSLPATTIDPAGPLAGIVRYDDPVIEWRNFLLKYKEPSVEPVVVETSSSFAVPVVSLLLVLMAIGATVFAFRQKSAHRGAWAAGVAVCIVGAFLARSTAVWDVRLPLSGAPDEAASKQIIDGILTNVNHAFLEIDPGARSRSLSVIVDEEGLKEVETELEEALAIKVAGGGIAKVAEIENLELAELTPLDGKDGFRSLAQWTAKAQAGHWGHTHRRTIKFRALLELVEKDGTWKLANITVVDAKQES